MRDLSERRRKSIVLLRYCLLLLTSLHRACALADWVLILSVWENYAARRFVNPWEVQVFVCFGAGDVAEEGLGFASCVVLALVGDADLLYMTGWVACVLDKIVQFGPSSELLGSSIGLRDRVLLLHDFLEVGLLLVLLFDQGNRNLVCLRHVGSFFHLILNLITVYSRPSSSYLGLVLLGCLFSIEELWHEHVDGVASTVLASVCLLLTSRCLLFLTESRWL
jgi:hypothetical protein